MTDLQTALKQQVNDSSIFTAPSIPRKIRDKVASRLGFQGSAKSIIAVCDRPAFACLFTPTHSVIGTECASPFAVAHADIAAVSVTMGIVTGKVEIAVRGDSSKVSVKLMDQDDCVLMASLLQVVSNADNHTANSIPSPVGVPALAGSTLLVSDTADATPTESPDDDDDDDSGTSLSDLFFGALTGIVAMALAPVTGGASLAVGAVGAVAGAGVAGHNRQQTAAAAVRTARERMAADYALKTAALQEAHAKAATRFKEHSDHNQLILCLIAVGASMTACDGTPRPGEIEQLREFSLGLLNTRLPPTVEKAVSSLLAAPPPFDQAMTYVDRLGPDVWPMIDAVLEVVSEADGTLTAAEQTFLAQWTAYKQDIRNEAVAS